MHKIKYLEGLRGIAALIVIFCHLNATCFLIQQQHLYLEINKLAVSGIVKSFIINSIDKLLDGELAVWIFWLLSSYVISILFFKKGENYDKILIGYFSKRYFRLAIPVLFSVLLAYFLLKFGLINSHKLALTLGSPYSDSNSWLNSFYTFEPNFIKAIKSALYDSFFRYKSVSSYNDVLWTIQNEFLGSLFTFSIFGIIRHNSRRYLLYFIIIIILLKLKILWLCAFVIGHVLCDFDFSTNSNSIINKLKKFEVGVHNFKLLILILSLLIIVYSRVILSFMLVPAIYHNLVLSSFIIYITLRNEYYKKIFASKIPFWLGDISFSSYLIHLPILCSLTSFLVLHNNTLQGKIFATLTTLIVIIFFSFLFAKYIDKRSIYYANGVGNYFKKYS